MILILFFSIGIDLVDFISLEDSILEHGIFWGGVLYIQSPPMS